LDTAVNRYFGDPWDAPIVAHAEPIATPVGRSCIICGEPIVQGEQGIMMPVFYRGPDGATVARLEPEHRGCALLGLVGHLAGTCFCRPDLGSIRQRGLATVAWWEADHAR
jgi:hypothetical protein